MKNRFLSSLGVLCAFGALTGCAVQPTTTEAGLASPAPADHAVEHSADAPLAFGGASAQPAADSHSLADAKPIEDGPDIANFKQVGRASWYGRRFDGRRTASGERYDMNALTAAHKTLPLASYVRVTNMANHKEVVVKINDRGPYVRGRVIDLSYAAAKLLGIQHRGTARVQIEGLTQEEARAARDQTLASNNVTSADAGN
jgi:rare lipoprotein A